MGNPEKAIAYWIPDLDFVSSGMMFGAASRLFQQPGRHYQSIEIGKVRKIMSERTRLIEKGQQTKTS